MLVALEKHRTFSQKFENAPKCCRVGNSDLYKVTATFS